MYRIASLCSVTRPSRGGQFRASSADRQACKRHEQLCERISKKMVHCTRTTVHGMSSRSELLGRRMREKAALMQSQRPTSECSFLFARMRAADAVPSRPAMR